MSKRLFLRTHPFRGFDAEKKQERERERGKERGRKRERKRWKEEKI